MVKISADSTCDLSPELLKRYDVAIQPLYIVRDTHPCATAWTSARLTFSPTWKRLASS